MTPEQSKLQNQETSTKESADFSPTTRDEQAPLEDPALQEKYRQAYLEQLRRQSCPGCGDDGPLAF